MEPIAIIGIGCRFPKATDPESFWQLLRNGVDTITEVPKDRWNVQAFYDPEPCTPGKMNTRWGGFLEQVDQFDPNFFGISPREVERMDPQQRLVLEVAWEAIENAGLAPEKLSGSQTGVFIGIGNYDYCRLLAQEDLTGVNAYDGTGNTLCIAANRLSYLLNLRGPSLAIGTACSSSLVALHYACRSLQSGESNLSLVGGVSLMLSPEPTITYSQARMMAADGRCKTFDASADGYVRGEGCGVIILKRLSDALRDRDNIQAVIRGSAVNQDGLSNGLTAPNGPSQQAVIRRALEDAGVAPAQISYVEAHGTGTALGDPIEVKSLKAVLMEGRKLEQTCWLGSLKTNIGHLEAASGIASVIKVVLALQHREIPPHLHLNQLNPYINLEGTTFSISTDRQPWSGVEHRLAGISAFGFGGTNCHVVLEEAPAPEPVASQSDRPLNLLTLSAKTEKALRELAQRYADFLATHPETVLGDVCFTANTGRSHFEHRLAVVAESTRQLQEELSAFAARQDAGLVSNQANPKKPPKIAFLFTGQGSQYLGMGRQLYETQPLFQQTLDYCDEILRPRLEESLLELLFGEGEQALLSETAYTQPALFALEYSLAQLWKSWGIEPSAVMGHSVGEYVAACVAGVFSLEDGLKLIAERGRLMQALPPDGEMVALLANESQVREAIAPYAQKVAIAAVNGPQSLVISGQRDCVRAAIATLQAEEVKTKKLSVSHAFHSPLMEPMLTAFEQVAAEVTYSSPQIKLISNVTGIATAEIAHPQYWCHHVRQPVKFAAGMEALYQQGYRVFVEIGPKPILSSMGRSCLPEGEGVWLPSLRPDRTCWQQILQSLAELYVRGVPVDWSAFERNYPRRRIVLPTYPFQRQRYWAATSSKGYQLEFVSDADIQTPTLNLLHQGDTQKLTQQLATVGKLSAEEVKLLPKLLEVLAEQHQQQLRIASIKDWLYEIEWQLKPRQLTTQAKNGGCSSGSWLIFADLKGLGQTLADLLQEQGHRCLIVYSGEDYLLKTPRTWSINPSCPGDYERLFQEVALEPLQGVIHLWSLDAGTSSQLTIPSLEQAQVVGAASALHLVQALVKCGAVLPRLWLVTQGAVPVNSSPLEVAQAPLWGLGKVIALEYPELWGGIVDVSPDASLNEVKELLVEVEDSQGEDHLAFREGQRYVARLVPSQPPHSQEMRFRANGTYLITGGLGALGLKVAGWMVEQGARYLVLTSRRGVSSQTQETLTQMRQTGARVIVAQADVSSQEDMVKLLEVVQASMPPLGGIIHAAGISDYRAIEDIGLNDLESVLRPKVVGTWVLHQLTQAMKLDFFVCFSSIASVWGSKGQAHYAAANQFLDGLAHYRRSLGLPALSINWGPWAGGGMALAEFQTWLTRMGVEALQPEKALAALDYLLGAGSVQTTVASIDWTLFKGIYEARKKRPLLEQLGEQSQAEQGTEREENLQPVSTILQQLKAAPIQDRHSLLRTYLQNEVAKVLKLDRSQLPDPQHGLFDMGMDSLMAIELVNLIQSQLQTKFSMLEILQAGNISTLTALLLKQLSPEAATSDITDNVLNLNDEAVLDDSIYPSTANAQKMAIEAILLTGATGFLGAFLLEELLKQTKADIYCLVRAADASSGMLKIQKNLQAYSLWREEHYSRIIPVTGDLSQPRLGLSADQFARMAAQIDVIYHNGATLNFVYPYSALKSTNVLGAQEILRLACQFKVKPLHYVSTDAVFDSSAYYGKEVKESEPIIHTEGLDLGYTQSKWVAEKLVTLARDRGLPVSIYRPPLIAGDSQTGIWNSNDFTCRFLKGCIQMGSMPDMNCGITIVPVNYVSRAIVYLSLQQESLGRAFHLNNPNFSSWSEVTHWIDAFGYPIRQIPYETWEAELIEVAQENVLGSLIPFFLRRWSEEQLTFAGLGQRRVKLNCEETVARLAGNSINCPRVGPQLLNTYFSYLIHSGFLNTPEVRAG